MIPFGRDENALVCGQIDANVIELEANAPFEAELDLEIRVAMTGGCLTLVKQAPAEMGTTEMQAAIPGLKGTNSLERGGQVFVGRQGGSGTDQTGVSG